MSKVSDPKPKAIEIFTVAISSILIVTIIASLIFGCGFFLWNLLSGVCGDEIFQEIYSPDNQYKVIVFQRDCGSTTRLTTHVSILNANQHLSDRSGGTIFVVGESPDLTELQVIWKNNNLIQITYTSRFKIFTQETQFEDFQRIFQIQYQAKP